jgi:DNA polymerase III subunit chi
MQVDFYQLSRDPAEAAVAKLAVSATKAGKRLLVVCADGELTSRISAQLWAGAESFNAHGLAGGVHDSRQPILLAEQPQAANGARYLIMADGVWHDAALDFARAFLLFDERTVESARATWRALDGRDGVERRYWKQEDSGKWVQAA